MISASKTDVSRESVEDRRRRSCSVTGETFLSLCTKKKHLKQPEFSQTASTESGGVTSLCLPPAPRLSRWINPPTQRCHLSSFCSQVAPIETLPRRGRCVCSSPKALSWQTRRRSQQLVVKAPTSRCLLCVQRLFSILTA